MIPYLRIKIKSLAEEARIIKAAEDRLVRRMRNAKARNEPTSARSVQIREGMHEHRIKVVRLEQRASLLAYAYLRGKNFRQVEPHTDLDDIYTDRGKRTGVIVEKMLNMVGGFGFRDPYACKNPDQKRMQGNHSPFDITVVQSWFEAEPMVPKPAPKKLLDSDRLRVKLPIQFRVGDRIRRGRAGSAHSEYRIASIEGGISTLEKLG